MEIRHIIFCIFIASAVYVYFRGKVRFGLVRSLTDYQVLYLIILVLLVQRWAYRHFTAIPESIAMLWG